MAQLPTPSLPDNLPLHAWPATALLAAYARGALSPVAVTQAVIARIEACEPALRATYAFEPETALAMARASEARWRAGTPARCGGATLDGVPVTIKENVDTEGVHTPLGTAAKPIAPALRDAPPAARLREAGAVFVSKTTMPEFGCMSSGLSTFHPLTRNPWNVAMNPGGSSAGAGAAAAAGYGPLHLGTDIGGSVRFPAAWCGVTGLKPSLGRINIDPPYMGRAAGPLARSLSDVALMMSVLAQPDPLHRDHMNLPFADLDWGDLDVDMRGKRIGLLLDAGCGMPLDPQVRAAVEAAAERFRRAGFTIEPVAPWMNDTMLHGVDRFWRIRCAADIAAYSPENQEKVLPIVREWARPAKTFSADEGFTAYSQTVAVRARTVAATQAFDFILSPVSPNVSFPAEWPYPNNDVTRAHDQVGFTMPFNMSEQPALSMCCGYDAQGVPIGLQIAGRRFDDLGVLRLGRVWETLREPLRPWPDAF